MISKARPQNLIERDRTLDYPFENLGPERFQELCQALLATEYPNLQCFPVGQPDGGRDAVSYYTSADEGFIVFQVKYVRRPLAEKDPHKWLLGHLKEELPKVFRLRKEGARQYILMTNVPGTAHHHSGSIDKASRLLKQETGLESYCWWRDDLSRRLDNNWNLKWAYPEVMSGPDFLRAVIQAGVSEDTERRFASLRAFIRSQFSADEEVRFKQVELQNRLFDLFIDVPVRFNDENATKDQLNAFIGALTNYFRGQKDAPQSLDFRTFLSSNVRTRSDRMDSISGFGAASFLLNAQVQKQLPLLVIEGAPGQGKSTITQYLCQVYRAALLHEEQSPFIPAEARSSMPVRLPIRVDLRDYATWLAKKNPFSIEGEAVPAGWHKSLESFLAALVAEFSGGTQFSANDLLAVFRPSSVLLVLDGLDEVADISRRKEMVEEITRAVQRLMENTASLQVIVTSRPAAFANSPGMPHSRFPYLQLASLTKPSIMDYAGRWMKAKRLEGRDSHDFKKILTSKLDQPHLRDLARNPMQLAILLTLILTRGTSLPDKRTALYDFYIDLFFSREAEKSDIVRNHRQLLIDIHGYLGWLLHAESELGDSRASISQDRLLAVVSSYLEREGYDVNLAGRLFTGMVERVVALVSRIEGTFEFEVQPLREYFAAYHLYDTAPQSSAGKESTGSLPDRFEAIASNFYWLNVVRFFAGRYSKGELPSLIEGLQSLADSDDFGNIAHPRILAGSLLSDWVFTQSPRSVKEAVSFIFSDGKIRYITASTSMHYKPGAGFNLPIKCGREELISYVFSILGGSVQADFESELLQLVAENIEGPGEIRDQWQLSFNSAEGMERLKWLKRGLLLGVTHQLTAEEKNVMFSGLARTADGVQSLYEHGELPFLTNDEARFNLAVDVILDKSAHSMAISPSNSILDQLGGMIYPELFAFAFSHRDRVPLRKLLERYRFAFKEVGRTPVQIKRYAAYAKAAELIDAAEGSLDMPAATWATSIAPWDHICETGRRLYGNRWLLIKTARISAGIVSPTERYADHFDLFDDSKSLCKRARNGRLKSNHIEFWRKHLLRASSGWTAQFALVLLLSWAKTDVILKLQSEIEATLELLDQGEWARVFAASRWSPYNGSSHTKDWFADARKVPPDASMRFATALANRVTGAASQKLLSRFFSHTRGVDAVGMEFVMQNALDLPSLGRDEWNPNLDLVKQAYAAGFASEAQRFTETWRGFQNGTMPAKVARTIASSPLEFPGFLLALSTEARRAEVSSRVKLIAKIADANGWFPTSST